MALRALTGRRRTVLEAGLALVTISWPVKGLIFFWPPLTAGLTLTISFARPGRVKAPCFLRLPLISPARASNTEATCLRLRPVDSPMVASSWPLVGGLAAAAGFFAAGFLADLAMVFLLEWGFFRDMRLDVPAAFPMADGIFSMF